MNKRKMLLVCMMVLAVSLSACGKKNVEETQQTETTMTETMPTVQPTETERETIPGLAPFDGDVELDDGPDARETTAPTVAATESKDQSNNTSTPKPTTPKPTEPKPTEPKPTEPKPTEPKPTEPKPTEPEPTEPEPTEPEPTEPEPTEPKPTEPKPTEPKPEEQTEYEKYMAMSGTEQMAFMESFDSIDAFFSWLQDAKDEYDKTHPDIPIGSGNIDLNKENG